MDLRDAAHDRPTQTAAAFLLARASRKALAQARDLRLGQAGAAVFDDERGLPVVHRGADGDASTGGAVAQSVVDEILRQERTGAKVAEGANV